MAAFVLVSTCFAAGQAKPPTANEQSGPTDIPKFHTEARQILVVAAAWKRDGDNSTNESSIPSELHSRLPPQLVKRIPVPARGLTAKDFHVFDNGAEQSINYLKEADFPLLDITGHWQFSPTTRGMWGYPPWARHGPDTATEKFEDFEVPYSTYLIGYTPPALEPGECRPMRVVAEAYDVVLNRNRYCAPKNSDDFDASMAEGTTLGTQMRGLVNSTAQGSIKVAMRAFAFSSSAVLSLVSDSLPTGKATMLPEADFVYLVQVHDSNAPATVQIAVEFDAPQKVWQHHDCLKKHLALHVLGIAYKRNGEIAGQFGNSVACNWDSAGGLPQWLKNRQGEMPDMPVPSRFDTQIELSPGDYEVRVVVSDGKKSFGQARLPVQVNGFDGQQLAISDLALSSIQRDASWVVRAAATLTPASVVPTPLMSKSFQFIPDIDTHLRQNTPVALYLEIYEPLLKEQLKEQKATVYLRARVTDLRTNSLVLNTEPMSAAKWILPRNVLIPVGLKLGTDRLKKGAYRLEVQASDSAGRETGWRQAKFTIE